MTDTKVSSAEANSNDQLTDDQLETATGGTGLFGIIQSNFAPILPQINPSTPTPAAPRPGVGTTHRTN